MRGAWLMLQQEHPDDYVLASGVGAHGGRVRATRSRASVWTPSATCASTALVRPPERTPSVGDPRKARERLGWEPSVELRGAGASAWCAPTCARLAGASRAARRPRPASALHCPRLMTTVGVIGLGYVGLPLAVAFAREGCEVSAVDVDSRKIEAIEAGDSYIEDVPSERLRGGRRAAARDARATRGWPRPTRC